LFFSLSMSLLLMVSHVAIDMHFYFQLVRLLLCFLVLLVFFPSAFFFRMHCIINIAVIFAIIQHDGGTLNCRKPYYLINSTQFYSCRWMYGVCHQWPTIYISICPWKIITVLLSMHCWNTLNS
jgi:hypothetical protein